MKLIFIGSGSAFTVGTDNFQSNALFVNDHGEKLLLDCGSDARWGLYQQGFTYKDIQNVYISHLHADHTGGLEWLAFTHYFDTAVEKPNLFISEDQAHELWNHVLRGGLSSVEAKHVDLSTFFNVKLVIPNGFFTWSGIDFKLVQTLHVVYGFTIIPCYGLLFTINGKTIFFTADTQFAPKQILKFYSMADLIFQDCETSTQRSLVHAHYDELKTLDAPIKRKMWLYHFNPGELPEAEKDGFLGFVKKGQVFHF